MIDLVKARERLEEHVILDLISSKSPEIVNKSMTAQDIIIDNMVVNVDIPVADLHRVDYD